MMWAIKQTFPNGRTFIWPDTIRYTRKVAISDCVRGWEILEETKFTWRRLKKKFDLQAVKVEIREVKP